MGWAEIAIAHRNCAIAKPSTITETMSASSANALWRRIAHHVERQWPDIGFVAGGEAGTCSGWSSTTKTTGPSATA